MSETDEVEEKKRVILADKIPDKIRVLCANPDCKKKGRPTFICEVKVYIPVVGLLAEIFDLQCPRCKSINSFKINIRDKDR